MTSWRPVNQVNRWSDLSNVPGIQNTSISVRRSRGEAHKFSRERERESYTYSSRAFSLGERDIDCGWWLQERKSDFSAVCVCVLSIIVTLFASV